MEKNKYITVVGSTYLPKWYKGRLRSIKHTDKIRGDLTLESIKSARDLGVAMVVVDGGSPKTFLKEVKNIAHPNLILKKLRTKKRSPNRRLAIFTAAKNQECKAIVLTELEKTSLVKDCLDKITSPVIAGNADLVIPKREEVLFKKTYPHYMYDSEIEGNTLYNEELRSHNLWKIDSEELDVFFGPRVFRNDKKLLLSLFRLYKARVPVHFHSFIMDLEEYANAQFFPVVQALKKGKKVIGVTVPFEYPKLQKENETRGELEYFKVKRKLQKLTIIIELMHFMGYLDHKKKTRISSVRD